MECLIVTLDTPLFGSRTDNLWNIILAVDCQTTLIAFQFQEMSYDHDFNIFRVIYPPFVLVNCMICEIFPGGFDDQEKFLVSRNQFKNKIK